jgi:hypothetical protein
MVAIWTPDILTLPGKPPTRGFGGRLYFFSEKSQAVPVEGQLIVYAYDDSSARSHPNEPDRKYAFTPEQFKQHFGESDIGASYSVWIPWDAVGGDQKSISLVPVFTASTGQIMIGEQALNVLPGKKASGSPAAASPAAIGGIPTLNQVQSASHVSPQPAAPPSGESPPADSQSGIAPQDKPTGLHLKTTTIELPRSLQLRLMKEPPLAVGRNRPTAVPVNDPNGNWGIIQQTSQQVFPEVKPAERRGPDAPSLAPPAAARTEGRLPSARFDAPSFPVRDLLNGQPTPNPVVPQPAGDSPATRR